jgi:AraC-like DNA-binding protein
MHRDAMHGVSTGSYPKTADICLMKIFLPTYHIGHFLHQPNHPRDFALTRFEEMGELDIEDPHLHTFYEILWFDAGRSKQIIDYHEYEIEPQTLFFISPNQAHHFEEYQPLRGGSVFFTEAFFLLQQESPDQLLQMTFLDNHSSPPFLRLKAKVYAEIRQTLDLLYAEYARSDSSRTILQALLRVLLTQIQREIDQSTPAASPKKHFFLYKKLKQLIDQHFNENLSARDYAARLFITPHHLNSVVKTLTGKTTSKLIRARSMLEAKRLLTFSDASISEIAAHLGYDDLSYFAKVFKAETGCAPLVFRQEISEKYQNL